MRSIVSVVTSLLLVLATCSTLPAQDFDPIRLQTRISATIDQAAPAVVSVIGRGSAFSGVIVSPDGYVLSAGHTVEPGTRYRINLPDGRLLGARGLGSSEQLDCGMLKISQAQDLPFAQIGNSSELVRNQPCLGLSYPGGTHNRREPVARFGRIIQPRTRNGMIQSTAMMEPGDSGGALFDLHGNLIAIHSRIGRSTSRNYDVPIDTFKKHWASLKRAERFSNGPSLPRLGFEGEVTEREDGIAILSLTDDGLARQSGLQINDVITAIQDQDIKSIRGMRSQLLAAREQGIRKLKLTVRRDGKLTSLTMPFEIPEKGSSGSDVLQASDSPAPRGIAELARLPDQFSELESRLDDHCAVIESSLGGNRVQILATLIADSPFLISKSSMVGTRPVLNDHDRQLDLTIVQRDTANDLVLLRSPRTNSDGVALAGQSSDSPDVGHFLLTPHPHEPGQISIRGSGEFESRKRQSKGYLGVMLDTWAQGNGAELLEVQNGAARQAGLQAGDIIVQMDDTPITSRRDILRFLSGVDPYTAVTATVQRDEETIEKKIVLGAPPTGTGHAADMMAKSGRRDGFDRVFSHDANLQPDQCGGPVYNLAGEFVGINIARYSRVRSYTIPGRVLNQLVDAHR